MWVDAVRSVRHVSEGDDNRVSHLSPQRGSEQTSRERPQFIYFDSTTVLYCSVSLHEKTQTDAVFLSGYVDLTAVTYKHV